MSILPQRFYRAIAVEMPETLAPIDNGAVACSNEHERCGKRALRDSADCDRFHRPRVSLAASGPCARPAMQALLQADGCAVDGALDPVEQVRLGNRLGE